VPAGCLNSLEFLFAEQFTADEVSDTTWLRDAPMLVNKILYQFEPKQDLG
jgi:hypothetical protein